MRKHQSLIPNEKALAVTNIKQCRMSKLPDVNVFLRSPIFNKPSNFFFAAYCRS